MKNFEFKYDSSQSASKVQQLVIELSSAINQGLFKVGDLLPSINQLKRTTGLSRDTIFKAYNKLSQSGLIESAPAKNYHVIDSKVKILLLLDSYSPFKDVLYNALTGNLPDNYQVDLIFHHYNIQVFENLVINSIGRYNLYLVMNFNNEKISDVLQRIHPKKLLILDWGDYKSESYSYVCQNFETEAYKCFQQAKNKIKHYECFNFVYPLKTVHPMSTQKYFDKFCNEIGIAHKAIDKINHENILPGNAYLVFRQKELVEILKICRTQKYKVGKDVGIIAYNDTPLYEVIENGITSISTDFALMGKHAAVFIKTRKKIRKIIPTNLIIRGSL